MAKQKIRIRLKAYNWQLFVDSAEKIVETQNVQVQVYQVRFHFQLRSLCTQFYVLFTSTKILVNNSRCVTHKRLIDIVNPTPQTVDALMKLDLPSGVDIEIKL
ncbi:Small ribosomal subunit protein uS10 OS=Sporosarcina ureilytica OX=298596 GN=rpsJ PE=3 SV=1 [Lysinibacillus sphaericus]